MKKCIKCNTEKPDEDFHKDPKMASGRVNACKSCVSIAKLARTRADPEKAAQQSAEYYRENKEKYAKWAQDYRRKHKAKRAAHSAVGTALASGAIVRTPCEKCGNPQVDAHHDDYEKPLVVRWLCRSCHKRHHAEHDSVTPDTDSTTPSRSDFAQRFGTVDENNAILDGLKTRPKRRRQ